MELEKKVIVSLGENKRIVSFSTCAASDDVEALTQAICTAFKDVLQPDREFFLQIKNEEWGGAFLDVLGSDEIADRSVVRAVLKPVTEVCIF